MTVLIDRAVELTIQDTLVRRLRMSFTVNRSIRPEPNTAKIEVYNLKPDTRKKLQGRNVPLLLMAGYRESMQQLF